MFLKTLHLKAQAPKKATTNLSLMKKMDHQRDPKYKFNFQKHHQMTAFHAITRAVTQYRIC